MLFQPLKLKYKHFMQTFEYKHLSTEKFLYWYIFWLLKQTDLAEKLDQW